MNANNYDISTSIVTDIRSDKHGHTTFIHTVQKGTEH
jgi:hypothetical protein